MRITSRSAHLIVRFLAVVALLAAFPAARAEYLKYDYFSYPRFAEAVSTKDGHQPIVYTEDKAPVYRLTRIVVEGPSAESWIEALEVLNTMRRDAPRKVTKWYEEYRATGDAHCKSEWTVLSQTPSSLMFERKSDGCPPFEAQHMLGRVLYGKQQVWTLMATRKGQMDDATRAAWVAVLETAAIVD